jgi:hypothetical protein
MSDFKNWLEHEIIVAHQMQRLPFTEQWFQGEERALKRVLAKWKEETKE